MWFVSVIAICAKWLCEYLEGFGAMVIENIVKSLSRKEK